MGRWSRRSRPPTPGRACSTCTRSVGAAIRDSLAGQGTPGLVFCHLSHAYPDGASLYFTFISRARAGAEIEQWREVKRAACEAIVAAGATITHHHAVGRDHAPYMEAEVGGTGPRGAARGEGAARPGRDHEPRQAAARPASLRFGFAGFDDRAGDRAARTGGAAVARAPSSTSCACASAARSVVVGDQRDFHLVEAARRAGRAPAVAIWKRPEMIAVVGHRGRDQRQPFARRADQGDRVGLALRATVRGLWR